MLDKKIALEYLNKKKRKKRAAIVSLICSVILLFFIIIAFNLIYVDRFTIMVEKCPELTLSLDKKELTTKLTAPPLLKATDTQYSDIPEMITEGIGSKNSNEYFAYSFYLGGVSDDQLSINYNLALSLNKYSNGLDEAIRVMIIRNYDAPLIYSKPLANGCGKPIYSGQAHNESSKIDTGQVTKPFKNNKYIIVESYNINPNEFDKYTIVIWIDGWESVNEMKGGIFSADIKFSTYSIN